MTSSIKAIDFGKEIVIGGERYMLNPLNAALSLTTADLELGYAGFWAQCRLRLAQELGVADLPLTTVDDLTRTGLCRLKVLGPPRCAELRDMVDRAGGRVPLQSYDLGHIRDLLAEVFSPTVDAVLKNHFGSHYFVPFLNIFRTEPENESPSYHWHCDWGPTGHLKLFCYLAESDSHDGATIFLDRATTTLLTKIGFVFGQDCHVRNVNIEPLCEAYGIPYEPLALRPDEGEAALFEPAGLFHRGMVPTSGFRYVLQIGIVPSPVPWHSMLQQCGRLLQVNNGMFPNANALMAGRIEL